MRSVWRCVLSRCVCTRRCRRRAIRPYRSDRTVSGQMKYRLESHSMAFRSPEVCANCVHRHSLTPPSNCSTPTSASTGPALSMATPHRPAISTRTRPLVTSERARSGKQTARYRSAPNAVMCRMDENVQHSPANIDSLHTASPSNHGRNRHSCERKPQYALMHVNKIKRNYYKHLFDCSAIHY